MELIEYEFTFSRKVEETLTVRLQIPDAVTDIKEYARNYLDENGGDWSHVDSEIRLDDHGPTGWAFEIPEKTNDNSDKSNPK